MQMHCYMAASAQIGSRYVYFQMLHEVKYRPDRFEEKLHADMAQRGMSVYERIQNKRKVGHV